MRRPFEPGAGGRNQLDRPPPHVHVRLEVPHGEQGIAVRPEQDCYRDRLQSLAPVDIGTVNLEHDMRRVPLQNFPRALEHVQLSALQIEHDQADPAQIRLGRIIVDGRRRNSALRFDRGSECILADEGQMRLLAPQADRLDSEIVEAVQLGVAPKAGRLRFIRLEGVTGAAAAQGVGKRHRLVAEIGAADDRMLDGLREVDQQPGRLGFPDMVGPVGNGHHEIARDLGAVGEFQDEAVGQMLADQAGIGVERVDDRAGHIVPDGGESVLGKPFERLQRGDHRGARIRVASNRREGLSGGHG